MADTRMGGFFRDSKVVEAFVDERCVGEEPAALAMRAGGELVVTDGDRSTFCMLKEGKDGKIAVTYTHDAMKVIDDEADVFLLGTFDTPEEAFSAACAKLGLELTPQGPTP